jgi:hypothetical protein
MKDIWTKEEQEIIRNLYISNNMKDIKSFLPNRTYAAIQSKASLLGLKKRIFPSKDESFFDTPNIINSYISGFLAADGCITKDKQRIVINISEKDIELLYSIVNLTKYTGKIYKRTFKYNIPNYHDRTKPNYTGISKMASVHISKAARWIDNLEKIWNITPQKTYTLRPPNLIEKDYILAFIAGIIDGDGCIRNLKNFPKVSAISIYLIGTKALMEWIKNFVDNIAPPNITRQANLTKTTHDNIYRYAIHGFRVYLLGKKILNLKLPLLNRKWEKVKNYIQYVDSLQNKPKRMELYLKK